MFNQIKIKSVIIILKNKLIRLTHWRYKLNYGKARPNATTNS